MSGCKYTDDEIVKALNCCGSENCRGCPYWDYKCQGGNQMIRDAIDLINRQKAENERLTETSEEAVSCFHRMESLYNIKCMELKVAKTEAIKEFAERVKDIVDEPALIRGRVIDVTIAKIDNLVKEMTGEDDG